MARKKTFEDGTLVLIPSEERCVAMMGKEFVIESMGKYTDKIAKVKSSVIDVDDIYYMLENVVGRLDHIFPTEDDKDRLKHISSDEDFDYWRWPEKVLKGVE